jgi:sterol desaturase/sphingolipid hydroxylase (fatty acid hydroxylase superfamily)
LRDYNGIRLGIFLGVLLFGVLAELAFTRRPVQAGRGGRWAANLGLMLLGAAVLKVLLPMTAVQFAWWIEGKRLGLLNMVSWPLSVKILLGFLWLDLVIYWQHRLFHEIPLLWRLHKVHHTDLDLDASSGVRFHPLEMILSMLVKYAAIAAFGAHFLAVLLFEIVLNAASTFHHSAIALPSWLDGLVRRVTVTPDYHRVHHSVVVGETNSNYSFNPTIWDRLFGSYVPQPAGDHATLALGLAEHRDEAECASIGALLLMPFRSK